MLAVSRAKGHFTSPQNIDLFILDIHCRNYNPKLTTYYSLPYTLPANFDPPTFAAYPHQQHHITKDTRNVTFNHQPQP